MPTLTRWFLRAAIVHLVAALLLGVLLAVPGLAWLSGAWGPVYIHLLVVGWATQMIFGVGYWMFPRRQPLDLRVIPWPGWVCFAALNAGLAVRAVAEPLLALNGSPAAAAGAVVSAALQLAAMLLFAVMMWPRVMAR